jgi:hypothetical protein
MKFAIRSTDFNNGCEIVEKNKLLVVYFNLKQNRKKSLAGYDYPHVSMYCS